MNTASQSDKQIKWNYENTRRLMTLILSVCWLIGIVLISLIVVFGVCKYDGEMVTPATFLRLILDLFEISEDSEVGFYWGGMILGCIYLICSVILIRNMIESASLFRRSLDVRLKEQDRTLAILVLNKNFGKTIRVAMVYLITAQFLNRVSVGDGERLVLIPAIILFCITGVIVHYTYEKPRAITYVLVDTLRNVIMAIVMYNLYTILMVDAAQMVSSGLLRFISMGENELLEDVKDVLYALYYQIIYPILRVLLAYMCAHATEQIFGCITYYQMKRTEISKSRNFFKHILIMAAWLVGLHYIIEAALGNAGSGIIITYIRLNFLPMILFAITGMLTFRFVYPDEYALPDYLKIKNYPVFVKLKTLLQGKKTEQTEIVQREPDEIAENNEEQADVQKEETT